MSAEFVQNRMRDAELGRLPTLKYILRLVKRISKGVKVCI
jgi:hypothetical protein